MKIKFLGTNSRANMVHPCPSINSLIPPSFDPAEDWMDKMQLSEIFTDKRYGLYSIQLGFNYFILKCYQVLTTAIFIGSASTIHKSFKIMF